MAKEGIIRLIKESRSQHKYNTLTELTFSFMKFSIIFMLFIVALLSCNQNRNQEIALEGKSFVIITQANDSIKIEFAENCLRNFSWNFRLNQEWSYDIEKGKLFVDGKFYKLKNENKTHLTFINDIENTVLIEKTEAILTKSSLLGIWIKEDDYYLVSGIDSLPICPNSNKPQIPSIELYNDSFKINEICGSFKPEKYHLNLYFGTITFGENCTEFNQWQIKKINADTIVADIRNEKGSSIQYHEQVKLIRFPPHLAE